MEPRLGMGGGGAAGRRKRGGGWQEEDKGRGRRPGEEKHGQGGVIRRSDKEEHYNENNMISLEDRNEVSLKRSDLLFKKVSFKNLMMKQEVDIKYEKFITKYSV